MPTAMKEIISNLGSAVKSPRSLVSMCEHYSTRAQSYLTCELWFFLRLPAPFATGDRMQPDVSIRTTPAPGDLGAIVAMHGILYAREYGFDPTFEAYVAGPLADFVCAR